MQNNDRERSHSLQNGNNKKNICITNACTCSLYAPRIFFYRQEHFMSFFGWTGSLLSIVLHYLHDFFLQVGILSMKPVYQSYRCTGIFQSMKHSLFQAQSLRLPGYQIAYIVWGKKTSDSSVSMIYIMITSLS